MLAAQHRFLHSRNIQRLAVLQNLRTALIRNNSRKRGGLRVGGRMNLNILNDEEWRNLFRFTREEVELLVRALQLPEMVSAENRIVEDRRTALCMLLARLAYPNRLGDLAMKFGWSVERISRISSTTQELVHTRWRHLLDWDRVRLTPEKLLQYAQAVERKGAPIGTVWGFIDGTIRGIARPTCRQQTCYNGWKRKHCLKYHAVVTPDGLISHLFGPIDGRRNDAFLWQESGLLTVLQQHARSPDGRILQIYGDPAYSINSFLLSPYQGAHITPEQKQWNRSMSRLRIVAEWAFKEMVSMFGFLDYAKNQKLLLQPIGMQFRVAALLHNAHVCLHHPQITQYFQDWNEQEENQAEAIQDQLLEPPTLMEYFHN